MRLPLFAPPNGRPATGQASRIGDRDRERGAALLVVLAALVILTIMGVAYSASTRVEISVARNYRDRFEAKCLSESGIFRVLAELKNDSTYEDAYSDPWSSNQQHLFRVELGRGQYSILADDPEDDHQPRIGITDESGKVNLNIAGRDQLNRLPGISAAQVSAILDWRDSDDDVSEPDGAEREYYRSLPEPYQAKNAPFDTVMELLLVRGITQRDLWGEDRNQNGILDKAEDDGDVNPPPDNADGVLDKGWWPHVTVYSYENHIAPDDDPKLNLNTVDKQQLQDRLGEWLEESDADAILEFRGDDSNKFVTVADLLDVPLGEGGEKAFDADKFKAVVNYVTTVDEERIPGLININTAGREVLETIPDMSTKMAEAIVTGRFERGVYQSVGDLLDLDAFEHEDFKKVAAFLTVRSQVFRIVSYGSVRDGEVVAITQAVVDRGVRPYRILYWRTET